MLRTEVIYGVCLKRLAQYIDALRLQFPIKCILVAKYNFSDIYKRISYLGSAAAQSIIVMINKISF